MKARALRDADFDEIKSFRKKILAEIGQEKLKKLHETNKLLDLIVPLLYISLVILNLVYLGSQEMSLLWILLFLLQGFLLQALGLILHDVFTHRKSWGKFNFLGKQVFSIPLLMSAKNYEIVHVVHHDKVGSLEDPEGYKQDLNTHLKRFAFLTLPGFFLAVNRFFADTKTILWSNGVSFYDYANSVKDSGNQKVLIRERKLILCFCILIIISSFYFPKFIIGGYILPFIISLPIALTCRIILEHAELNPDNPIHIATNYKTGIISKFLFFWDSGDCHLIHHLFPNIPFYNISKAVNLIQPILKKEGVLERESFIVLLKGWLFKNYEHKSLWY